MQLPFTHKVIALHTHTHTHTHTHIHTHTHTHTLTRGGCQVLYFGDKKSDTLAKQLQFVESDGRVVDEITSFCEQCFAVRVISFEAYLEHARSQMQMIPFVYSNEVFARPSLSSKMRHSLRVCAGRVLHITHSAVANSVFAVARYYDTCVQERKTIFARAYIPRMRGANQTAATSRTS